VAEARAASAAHGARAGRAAEVLRCAVAVVGAGPAGIAAAVTAAEAGADVVLVDMTARPGGQVWRHADGAARGSAAALPRPARRWLARLDRSAVQVLAGWTVVDAWQQSDDGTAAVPAGPPSGAALSATPAASAPTPCLVLERGDAVLTVMADALVLATGARERFLPFDGWTLPGVFGIGGVQALLRSGLDVAGRRVVVAGSGPLLLPAAAAMARAGAEVVEVAEQAPAQRVMRFAASLWRSPLKLAYAAACRGAFAHGRYRAGTWVAQALPGRHHAHSSGRSAHTAGDDALAAVVLTDGRRVRTVSCDVLCTGYGLVPETALARLLGCALDDGCVAVDDGQRTTVPGVLCAGEPTGVDGMDGAIIEGRIAGIAAAGGEPAPRLVQARRRSRGFGLLLEETFAPRAELQRRVAADTIVCRCEDVRHGAIAACGSAREAKLVTRAGMGPCQGRVCGPATEFLFGWTGDTVRTPLLPARISTLIHGWGALTHGMATGEPARRMDDDEA
jgi:D-hydroxyproline dehydrogenase subunit alpha